MNNLESLFYDETDILERVDEYTLYCRYLHYEPLIGAKYHSPIRPHDDDPSFGVFERRYGHGAHEFLWKDQATGVHGDIFDLVAILYQVSRQRAMLQVCNDIGIGGMQVGTPKIVEYEAQYTNEIRIKIISRKFNRQDLDYWKQYNVDERLLQQYSVKALQAYWLTPDQTYPIYPKGLAFAYKIWDKYQLYFPKAEKHRKFRNNWTDICVPGLLQLRYNQPLCIITKAYKDVLCLRSLGYEAIAPKGENILLPKACITMLQNKYSRVVTLFDNDGKHKAAEYPFEELHVPAPSGAKDITDYCALYGPDATRELLSLLLHTQTSSHD